VFSWWHLRLLTRRMRSFGQVSFRVSAAGPAGGLVTFSRLPVSGTAYRGFGMPPAAAGVSRAARWRAALKGALVTRVARPGLWVVNTHPVANRDGDWSPDSRFYPLHRAQLDVLAQVVRGAGGPGVVCGDETPHCIDFILTAGGVKAEAATVLFTGKEPLGDGPGYVSDHLGLRASLFLPLG